MEAQPDRKATIRYQSPRAVLRAIQIFIDYTRFIVYQFVITSFNLT